MNELNSQQAQLLVDHVVAAENSEAAAKAAEEAFSFLVGQLHILAERANGYPRGPIEGAVWKAGCALTAVCDRFADSVARWHQTRGEEQATGLAVAMAMQVVGHYPDQIFPRVLRNARCRESLGMTDEAVEGYRCIVDDFRALELEALLEPADPVGADAVAILTALRQALDALQRLAAQGLSDAELELRKQVDTVIPAP